MQYSRIVRGSRLLLASVVLFGVASCSDQSSVDPTTPNSHYIDAEAELTTGIRVVVITPSTLTLNVGAKGQLSAGVFRDGLPVATDGAFVWSSLSSQVASVDQTGMVTGLAGGTAAIVAAQPCCGRADTALVTVQQVAALSSIAVSPANSSVAVGANVQLSATALDQTGKPMTGQSFAWTSSNAQVATVSATGLVKGLAAGTVTISASSGGKVGTAQVSVTTTTAPPPPSGSYSPPNIAFTNFDAGNSAPFIAGNGLTTGSTDVKFMADPTGKFGAGKVMQIHYVRTSTAAAPDVDRNVFYRKGIHWGETVFMRGHVLIPTPQAGMSTAMRKLMYVMTAATSKSFSVIRANGQTLYAEFSGTTTTSRVVTIGAFPFDVKHSIEMQMTINSAAGVPDGILRVWLDGVLQTDLHDVNWIKASDAATSFNTFKFGQQTQKDASALFDEVRYWDNIALSTTRIGP